MRELVIENIGELLTLALPDVGLVRDAALVIREGQVVFAGPRASLRADDVSAEAERLDAGGRLVTPGLVDPHAHLIFAGSRAHEFDLRAQGKTYLEIQAAGGGILSTVRAVRVGRRRGAARRRRRAARPFSGAGRDGARVQDRLRSDHRGRAAPVAPLSALARADADRPGADAARARAAARGRSRKLHRALLHAGDPRGRRRQAGRGGRRLLRRRRLYARRDARAARIGAPSRSRAARARRAVHLYRRRRAGGVTGRTLRRASRAVQTPTLRARWPPPAPSAICCRARRSPCDCRGPTRAASTPPAAPSRSAPTATRARRSPSHCR